MFLSTPYPAQNFLNAADMQVQAQGSDSSHRVVITGQGVVSSLGQDVDEFYSNLLQVIHFRNKTTLSLQAPCIPSSLETTGL
jgi:hypothetical protein